MRKFFSTKLFKVLFVTLLLSVLIFANPYNAFIPFRSVLANVLMPFQKVFYSLSYGFGNTSDFLGSIGQLKNENEKLIKEKQELLANNAKLADVENENTILRQQLDILPRDKFDLLASNIVSQDPNGMGNWIVIDKGSEAGVKVGMSVIVSKGILLGRVQEVTAKSSNILLLTNSKSTVNAMTTENGTKGIVKGEYGLAIILDMILQTDLIQVGDDVVTSGIGEEFPRGLFVGVIQEVHRSDDNLFQQAVISSPIQVSKLQMVFVIKNEKK
jgi:rod shape-determining protein MreC